MRCVRPLALCAFAALALLNGFVSSRGVVLPRQGELSATASGDTNAPSTTAAPQRPTEASITGGIPSATSVTPVVSKEASGTQTTETDATSTDGPVPTASGSLDSENSMISPEDQVYQGGLPIKPKVNPGLAVAGVILMLAGVPYCLIGIKLKFLHIFLSTFFLSGLGVTVLIVYVMNPPVKDAIQGAYVTAIVITGILTGALAIVFPEVTEALGCLLGGFCVSMWFLVLKPGGLVTSVYGKLVLIAAFCFVTFSLAFHHVTRPYSMIFSLSFSGATAVVLGIDCFSTAGLKEFWIYIWALNDNIFPLGTNNYPHTRGIRVEIAVIVLITAFGIMSQVKLWKILKERRDTRDTEKRRQAADLEALDEDVGRRVEESQKVERAQWEMTYGGKSVAGVTEEERPNTGNMSRADSGIGDEDFRKRSGEVEEFVETEEMKREREEHIQMTGSRKQSLEVPSQQSGQGDQIRRMVMSVGVDEIQEVESMAFRKESEPLVPGSDSRRQSTQSNRRQSSQSWRLSSQAAASPPKATAEKPDVPPAPEVIPLPFPIPAEDEGDGDDDEVSSLATWAGESVRSAMPGDQELVEVIITPTLMKSEDDDDRASSVAATLDEDYDGLDARGDLPAINEVSEGSTSPFLAENNITLTGTSFKIPTSPGTQESTPEKRGTYYLPVLEVQPSESGKDSSMSSFDKGAFTGNHSKTNTTHQTTPAATSPPSVDEPSPRATKFPESLVPASFPKQDTTASSSVGANFNPQLQAKCSRVVKNYRTNEWAKHLADAEKPELDELEEPRIVADTPVEVSVPVHIKELQETSEIPSQPQRSASKMSMHEPVNPAIVSNSFPITNPTTRPVPRTSPIPVAPQEEHQSSASPADRCISPAGGRGRLTPSPLPHNTLIKKRESMVRSRHTFNTLLENDPPSPTGSPDLTRSQSPNIGLINHPFMTQARSPTPGVHPSQLPTNDNPSAYQHRAGMLDDDMPLADRRNELLHHSGSQNTLNQGRRSFTPVQQPADRREAMLKSWRESIKTELQNTGHTAHAIQERRGDMLTERQQLALAERQKSMKENFRDEMVDERMRQKDMLELHKEALRKMQAGANKHI